MDRVAGNPESPLRWTTKPARHLAAALTAAGHQASALTVAALLKQESFSLQGNVKTLEVLGTPTVMPSSVTSTARPPITSTPANR